jgi:tRNA(Arg) A34 adenosine deaminase TadA
MPSINKQTIKSIPERYQDSALENTKSALTLTDGEFMAYLCSLGEERRALLASPKEDFDKDTPFYSGIEGFMVDEQPAANILHKVDKIHKPMHMYLNYEPSELELGLFWRARMIKNVFFVKNYEPFEVGFYKVNQHGCELVENFEFILPILDDYALHALEITEPRLKAAIDNPEYQRRLPQELIEHLRRGLDSAQESQAIDDQRPMRLINEDFTRVVLSLVSRSWTNHDGTQKPIARAAGNNVGAIMVDKVNRIIGWGLNFKDVNRTFHAESTMIQQWLRENEATELPEGVRIFTSLQCCHMCSGYISVVGKNVRVIYAQEDPYFKGKNSLERGINGCTEEATTLPVKDSFKSAIGEQKILDFLFGLNPEPEKEYGEKTFSLCNSKELFTRALRDQQLFSELAEVVATKNNLLAQELGYEVSEDEEGVVEFTTPLLREESPVLNKAHHFLNELGDIAPEETDGLFPVHEQSASIQKTIQCGFFDKQRSNNRVASIEENNDIEHKPS